MMKWLIGIFPVVRILNFFHYMSVRKIGALALLIYGWVTLGTSGCSKVDFSALPDESCLSMNQAYGGSACAVGPSGLQSYNYTVVTGSVDLLLIDDNSGSMYVEQEKMANQFPDFLDSISKLSYNIAITSTDVDSSGEGRDGRFFNFGNGQNVLSNTTRTKDSTHYANIPLFQNTIKRSETLDCPDGPSCPSGDERGIYAAVRAMERVENRDFFRPGGHLAIVILSDEDERSSGGGAPGSEVNGGPISQNYLQGFKDKPETLVSMAKEILSPGKSMSVHSIIIRPGDTTCFQNQNSQGGGVKGFYGTQYAKLSSPSAELKSMGPLKIGTLGNICSSNYTVEMGEIAQYIKTSRIQLPCKPVSGSLNVTYLDGVTANQKEILSDTNQLEFIPAIEAGHKIQLEFSCNR